MNFSDNSTEQTQYKFKELATLAGVKPYVLRFWESEFEQIKPDTSSGGEKIYSQEDFNYVTRIKSLLFDEKFSITEAKAQLDQALKESSEPEIPNVEEIDLEALTSNERIFAYESSMDLMKQSLGRDLTEAQTVKKPLQAAFSDQNLVALIQAKKKLNTCLRKIDQIEAQF